MRSVVVFVIICTALLATAIVVATPNTDHPEAELHPRGELAAEQIARIKANPPIEITGTTTGFSDGETAFLDQLKQAKTDGDQATIISCEEQLAELRGKPLEFVGSDQAEEQGVRFVLGPQNGPAGEKWLPHEFLLAGEDFAEAKPTMAADNAGNLYAAFEAGTEDTDRTIHVYKSSDGGEHWEQIIWLGGVDVISPSIAIAEGGENLLMVAFHNTSAQSVSVARMSLDDSGIFDFRTVITNIPGVSNPRIVTDSSEYSGWYAYVVCNALAVDNWVFIHSRTLDYGDNWTTYDIIGGYCGYPGEFYDATNAHPDIEFGSGVLYVAFDNYPSPCVTDTRDIYILNSQDYGSTWSEATQLTTSDDDEHDPAIAAVKFYSEAKTVVVAHTRYYSELDDDVWYARTQDGGETWTTSNCIACATPEERNVNLATSGNLGALHAAYWDEFNINYATATYDTPNAWVRTDSLITNNYASDNGCRPGLLVNPTKPVAEEAAIAWTDFRNESTMDLDIYFDAAVLPEVPDDYYLYSSFNPGLGYCCGIDGYIDETGAIEGIPGGQYIIFTAPLVYEGDITAYIYRVDTAGDPETHPDNPMNTGPIAPRTYTYVSEHYMGYYACGHDNEFYVDESGIYYGPSNNARSGTDGWATFMDCAIYHWNFDWTPIGCEVELPAPAGNQTLGRNTMTGEWWGCTAARRLYKFDGASWVYQFTHPHLGGSHHDGLEIIGSSVYPTDMTSDVLIQYRLDDAGNVIDSPTEPAKTFFYTADPAVEGMGYGPNNHIWMSGGTIYELGGGVLQLAIEGIPHQCVVPGGTFDIFDLDNYTAGVPPYSWEWSGHSALNISVNSENIVTVTYPYGWTGQETITFTVTDGLARIASDQAIFTVSPMPIVGNIPDQTDPFEAFDLDDYLLDGIPELITWSATGMTCLDVLIDPVTHVVQIIDPGECSTPEEIVFTAAIAPCADYMYDSDAAIFEPGSVGLTPQPVVAFALGQPTPNPCTTSTQVRFSIPSGAHNSAVTLAVFDLRGRRVRMLLNDSESTAGNLITWDGNDDQGSPVPSGTYFFQLQWSGKYLSQQVIMLR